MKNEFVKYEQALALKELGFDEPCLGYYDEGGNLYTEMVEVLKAPLYQQAFRWFREKHKIVAAITVRNDDFDYTIFIPWNIEYYEDNTKYNTYEEAEQACMNNVIEIVNNK